MVYIGDDISEFTDLPFQGTYFPPVLPQDFHP
jgi:hypothetical protein